MLNINKFYFFILSITLIIFQASSSKDSLMSQASSFNSSTFLVSPVTSSNKVDSLASNPTESQASETNCTNDKEGHSLSDSGTDTKTEVKTNFSSTLSYPNILASETNRTNDKGWYFFSDSETEAQTNLASISSNPNIPNQVTAPQALETNCINDKEWHSFSNSKIGLKTEAKTNFDPISSKINTPSEDTDPVNKVNKVNNSNKGLNLTKNIMAKNSPILTPFNSHQIPESLKSLKGQVIEEIRIQTQSNSQKDLISNNYRYHPSSQNEFIQQIQTPLIPEVNSPSNKYINILKKVGTCALITNTEFSLASTFWCVIKGKHHTLEYTIGLVLDLVCCMPPLLYPGQALRTLRDIKVSPSTALGQLMSSLLISAGLLYLFIKYNDISPDICFIVNIFSDILTWSILSIGGGILIIPRDI